MSTASHNTIIGQDGRNAAPSVGFAPHPDITRAAESWLIQQRIERPGAGHARIEFQDKPAAEQYILECASCELGVFILSPDLGGAGYVVNTAQITAAVVQHLHNHHPEAL